MAIPCPLLQNGSPLVVGSAATAADLLSATTEAAASCCDLVEVRLDLLEDPARLPEDPARLPEDSTHLPESPAHLPWQHLDSLPLLFTARRASEGGSGDLNARERSNLLLAVLDEASLIDIEVASISEMGELIAELKKRELPWVASFHDFDKLPENAVMEKAADEARKAGAAAFKVAAHLEEAIDLERLVDFQKADHGLPCSTMGMGALGAQSRIRCAQAGSVLNYGYLGETPTAPGQMSAAELMRALK